MYDSDPTSTCPLLISTRQIMMRSHPYLTIAYLTKFPLRYRQPISLTLLILSSLLSSFLLPCLNYLLLTLQAQCLTQPSLRNHSSTNISHSPLMANLFGHFILKTVEIRSLTILGHAAVEDAGTYLLTTLLSMYHHLHKTQIQANLVD